MSEYSVRLDRFKSRYGKPFKEDKNGTLYFCDNMCRRCEGHGRRSEWAYTGSVCYECGGSGISTPHTVKLYLPEYEAKLEERRKLKEEKRKAEHDAEYPRIKAEWLKNHGWSADGHAYLFLGNTFEIKEKLKDLGAHFNYTMGWYIDHEVDGYEFLKVSVEDCLEEVWEGYIEKVQNLDDLKSAKYRELHPSKSDYVGNDGERLKGLKLKLDFVVAMEGEKYTYYDNGIRYLHSMSDENGNKFTWTTSGRLNVREGETVVIDGTVKGHKEYKGERQTVLTRCKMH